MKKSITIKIDNESIDVECLIEKQDSYCNIIFEQPVEIKAGQIIAIPFNDEELLAELSATMSIKRCCIVKKKA